jgi:hypothetical protein
LLQTSQQKKNPAAKSLKLFKFQQKPYCRAFVFSGKYKMDIKELQNYRLSDAVKFHKTLNPKIWGTNEHLLPEVREKLLAIAADFQEFLGLDLEVKDVTISGSNAAYTYTDHSDIDLHLVTDIPRADSDDVYRELFDAKKYQYNDQHDFVIGKYPVELYVQNANQDHVSQGIYSVTNNTWISVPKRRQPDINDISVRSKYEDMGQRIDAAIESGDLEKLDAIGNKLRSFRQAGLDASGEFGPENLAFKVLRNNGTLDRLRAARTAAKNQALSLTEKKKKRKKKTRYGHFGGVFFPGYHYYGQTDAAADGGGDGGGESVQESADDLQTQLEKFAAFCVKKLGIENPPGIQLKRDPEWSRRNATFGRYVPETNVMILSVADRHPMDIMRTLAHELVHRNQDEHEPMPDHAGETGSEWENEANARAGVLMRSYGEQNPDTFDKKALAEASGYIPTTDAEAQDPRYSMAVTVDIKPGEPKRQAAKLGWKTNAAGTPPTARTNGLIEELTRKLQMVKEGIGFPLVSEEEELEEVAMSPGSLKSWAASDVGQSMQAGFEAELVFSGVNTGSNDSGEMEPDYDYDPRADDIDGIMYFFTDGDMSGIDSRPESRSYRIARSQLEEDYFDWYSEHVAEEFSNQEEDLIEEWILNNDWDQDRQIEEFLREELELSADEIRDIMSAMERRVAGKGTAADADLVAKYNEARAGVKEQLELRVTDAIQENNSDWESAQDEFRENYSDADESDWLRDRGYRYMSDVGNAFDFEWPRWTTTGGDDEAGYNSEAAQQLADSLTDTLDVETTVASGYHSAQRDDKTWIFEPDSSLDADESGDMPVEIVSPPMPLGRTLEILPKFFAWAKDNGAYANDSTGFHMSVSMPDHGENVLDYTKLALFLGDEYVLKQFGREANTYAKSAISKIRDTMGKLNEATETRAEAVLSAMRNHLNQFASRAIAQPSGFGKYTSINPKTNYIEFRSAGGSDYFADMDKIQNTLMRYARATDIAMDPAAEKAEYARKLYKLLTRTETEQVTDPKTGRTRTEVKGKNDNDAISIFSRYVAGDLPKTELKGFLKQLQYGREVAKNPPKEKIQWKVTHPNRRATITLMASSAAEAIKLAKQEYNDTMNPDDAYKAEPVVPAAQTPATDQLNAPVPDDPQGNFVLRRREGNEGVGPVLYRFSAGTTGDAINAARRWTEARGMERRSVYLDSIESLSPEELRAAPAASGERRSYVIYDRNNNRNIVGFVAPNSDAANERFQRYRQDHPSANVDLRYADDTADSSAASTPPVETEPQNFPAAGNAFSGEWKVVDGLNREVYRFSSGGDTSQADANRVAREWAQRTGFDGTLEVYPVMR